MTGIHTKNGETTVDTNQEMRFFENTGRFLWQKNVSLDDNLPCGRRSGKDA
jgi:hypothetical protein